MNTTPLTQHEVFWLASHTHNKLAPLIKAAQQYDPTIRLTIEMKFAGPVEHILAGSVSACIFQENPHLGILTSVNVIRDKAGLKGMAAVVQRFIDTEQAALELAADLAADADFEYRQERAAERADIEHDQDAHDIYLQNEMAGN